MYISNIKTNSGEPFIRRTLRFPSPIRRGTVLKAFAINAYRATATIVVRRRAWTSLSRYSKQSRRPHTHIDARHAAKIRQNSSQRARAAAHASRSRKSCIDLRARAMASDDRVLRRPFVSLRFVLLSSKLVYRITGAHVRLSRAIRCTERGRRYFWARAAPADDTTVRRSVMRLTCRS